MVVVVVVIAVLSVPVNLFVGAARCNQVKINPVVKYDWEPRRYIGRLIAVHLNHTHVAYVLRGRSTVVTANYHCSHFCLP